MCWNRFCAVVGTKDRSGCSFQRWHIRSSSMQCIGAEPKRIKLLRSPSVNISVRQDYFASNPWNTETTCILNIIYLKKACSFPYIIISQVGNRSFKTSLLFRIDFLMLMIFLRQHHRHPRFEERLHIRTIKGWQHCSLTIISKLAYYIYR